MADLRLALDDHLLRRVNDKIHREDTSLDAVVSGFLTQWVGDADSHTNAARQTLIALDNLTYRSGGVSWTRDELHER